MLCLYRIIVEFTGHIDCKKRWFAKPTSRDGSLLPTYG